MPLSTEKWSTIRKLSTGVPGSMIFSAAACPNIHAISSPVSPATGKTTLAQQLMFAFTELTLSPYAISFLSDDIILLRYVEIHGQLRKAQLVLKMRGGNHSKDGDGP